jgi:hypothetical protein
MLAPLGKILAWAGAHWEQLVVLFLVAVPVAWISVQVDRWMRPERAVPKPDTVTVAEPMRPGDILDATTPTQVAEHDTSDTRTECIQVPTWLASMQTGRRNGGGRPQLVETDSMSSTDGSQVNAIRMGGSLMRGGPTYAITPLTSGSPSLSVGSRKATLQGYLPSGEGRQWSYDLPQDTWHLWPSLTASTTPLGLQASAQANLRWEKVTVSAGYMQAAEDRGITFSVRLRPFTISW